MTLLALDPTKRRCSSRPSIEVPIFRTNIPLPEPETREERDARQTVLEPCFPTRTRRSPSIVIVRFAANSKRVLRLRTRRYQHQLNEHLEHVRPKIHTRCVGKVFVYVTKGTGGSKERVDRLVQASRGQTILLRSQLSVQSGCVEQNRSLLERDRSLATGNPCQRVEPLEIDAQTSIGREESSLDEVQLIVVA